MLQNPPKTCRKLREVGMRRGGLLVLGEVGLQLISLIV